MRKGGGGIVGTVLLNVVGIKQRGSYGNETDFTVKVK